MKKSHSNQHEYKAHTIWFTGLSGSGKSTLSEKLGHALKKRGLPVEILDGDEVRTHFSKGLGFTKEDRITNVKRIGYVCKLLTRNNIWTLTAAISPYEEGRAFVRNEIKNFIEVFVECSIDELARRDVKGLYKKALAGEIKNFTGVSDPYEAPEKPDIHVNSETESVEESFKKIIHFLESQKLIPNESAG